MQDAQLETIDKAIAKAEAKLAEINRLIDARRAARIELEAAVTAAQADLDALKPRLEVLLASEAVGDPVGDELAVVRAALTAATKRLSAARKREPDAMELALAENGLARHLEPIHAELTKLFNERERVRVVRIKALAAEKLDSYASAATQLAELFAEVLAVNNEIVDIVKADPGIMAPQSMRICLPGFMGQPEHFLPAGAFPEIRAAAARRVRSALEAEGVV